MIPEDVKPEWVEKAARAVYAAAEHRAECDGTIDSGDWEEWDPENPFFSELLMEQRIALAAVLPEAMTEALAKYLDAYVEWQPRMGDSNAAFAVLREMAAEVNRLREGSES